MSSSPCSTGRTKGTSVQGVTSRLVEQRQDLWGNLTRWLVAEIWADTKAGVQSVNARNLSRVATVCRDLLSISEFQMLPSPQLNRAGNAIILISMQNFVIQNPTVCAPFTQLRLVCEVHEVNVLHEVHGVHASGTRVHSCFASYMSCLLPSSTSAQLFFVDPLTPFINPLPAYTVLLRLLRVVAVVHSPQCHRSGRRLVVELCSAHICVIDRIVFLV